MEKATGRELSLSKVQFFLLFLCVCVSACVCACLGYAAVSGPSYQLARKGWLKGQNHNAFDNIDSFYGSQQPLDVNTNSTQQTEAQMLDDTVTTPNISRVPKTPMADVNAAIAVIHEVEATLKKSGQSGDSFKAVAKRVCKVLYCDANAPRVLTAKHHKTGHSLAHQMTKEMEQFCPCYNRQLLMGFAQRTGKNGPIAKKYKSFIESEVFPKGYTMLHFNRQPVATVVSAYFYHQVSAEPIGTQMIKSMHFNDERITMQFEDTSQNAHRRLLGRNRTTARRLAYVRPNEGNSGGQRDARYNKVWNEVIDANPLRELGLVGNGTAVRIRTHHSMSQCVFTALPTAFPFLKDVSKSDAYFVEIKRVIEKLKKPETTTLQKVYNNWPVKDGLMAELLRYFHCEMPNGLLAHLTAKRFAEAFSIMNGLSTDNRKRGTVLTFDLDNTTFAEMAYGMVDAFNIRHSDANERMLQPLAAEFGISGTALITAARYSITEHLADTCDLKRKRASKDHHSTHNKHPPAPFRQQLVEISPAICQLLKRLTLAMDLNWQYTDVC